MEESDKMLLVRNYNLWSQVNEEEYKALNVVDNYKEARQGQFIYFEAFHYNMVHFIKQGYIRLGYLDEQGNQVTKEILKKGDIFGQIILEKNDLHGEFAQAIKSDVSFCSFTVDNFNNLLRKRPDMAIRYSKLVGLRLKRFENRLINILQNDVKTRLVNFFAQMLHDQPGGDNLPASSMRIPNVLTHEEIANLIGASRQSVTTLMNELKEEGILDYNRKEIRLLKAKTP
ncbi:MAG TPA: Crp/Fnr family transcriptional regulator [Puia sp.]|nr:Crp/Fnr family transcriptional regulator [Puia sp.]